MSVQIFLQGKLLGIEEFLLAPAEHDTSSVFLGRSHWTSLLAEVLPRALLSELGLARILLGSSGGGQFLLVLPEEVRDAAETFLTLAAQEIGEMSGSQLKLIWSLTENLGDWSDIRKRLQEGLDRKRGAPASVLDAATFTQPEGVPEGTEEYFAGYLGEKLRDAESAGWSPEHPGRILIGEGTQAPPRSDTEEEPLAAASVASLRSSKANTPGAWRLRAIPFPLLAMPRLPMIFISPRPAKFWRGGRWGFLPGVCCAATSTILISGCGARRTSKNISSSR